MDMWIRPNVNQITEILLIDNPSDPNIYSYYNFCNELYIYKYKIQFIVSWGCVALTPKNSLRISLPLLRIIFNATANIPIIGKIIWEIYMISQAGYFPNWSGDILKNESFFLGHNDNFFSQTVRTILEAKYQFMWWVKIQFKEKTTFVFQNIPCWIWKISCLADHIYFSDNFTNDWNICSSIENSSEEWQRYA